MAKKMIGRGDPIYVVTMRRFGDLDRHAYVLGVYRQKHRAQQEAAEEQAARGDKYIAEIAEMVLDVNFRTQLDTAQEQW